MDDAYLNVTTISTCPKSVAASFNENSSTFYWFCAGGYNYRGMCTDPNACRSKGCYYCSQTSFAFSHNFCGIFSNSNCNPGYNFCTDFPNTNSTTHSCSNTYAWDWNYFFCTLFIILLILYVMYHIISFIICFVMRCVLRYTWHETNLCLNYNCFGYGTCMENSCKNTAGESGLLMLQGDMP